MKRLLFLFFLLYCLSGWCHINGDTSSCKGKQSIYTSSLFSIGNLWNVTGSNYSTPVTDTSFLVNWGAPGTYTVSLIFDSAGHIDTTQIQVTVHDIPYPYIKPLQNNLCLTASGGIRGSSGTGTSFSGNNSNIAPGCYVVCDSGWYQYTVIGQAGSTFTWASSTHDSIQQNPNGDTVNIHWSGHGDKTLYCTETNTYGCQNSTSICLSVIGKPQACMVSFPTDSSGIIHLCLGSPVTFNDNCSKVPFGSDIVSRIWLMGDGTMISDQTIVTYEYLTAGTYHLKYFVQTNCSCADTFRMTIIVDSGKGPDIYCISTRCADSISIYTTSDTCHTGFLWTITGGDTLFTRLDTVAVRWGDSNDGYGIVSLKTNCSGQCPYPTKAYVPIVPKHAAITGPQVVCRGDRDIYTVPFVPSTVYTWYSPRLLSHVLSGQSTNQLEWIWTDSVGSHDSIKVTYSNPFLHCGGLSEIPISVAREYTISGATQACLGLPDTFRALSDSLPISCRWAVYTYSGTTRVDTATGLSIYLPVISSAGTYRVRAYPDTGFFCGSPQELLVTVFDLPTIPANPIIGADTVCAGEIYTYLTSSGSPAYYLEWKTYNATPASASGNQIQLSWVAPFNDTLYVRNVMIDNPGCPSPWRKEVIYPLTNLHPTITGDTSSCSDQVKNYSTGFTADDYSWSVIPLSAGSVSIGQNTSAISLQWNHTDTTVHAHVILQIKKCSQTIYDTIAVSIYPVPSLSLTIDSPVCVGATVNMSVSPAGSSVDWSFGDGTTHGTTSPVTHSYAVDRSYSILATVTAPGGCPVTRQSARTISVFPSPQAYLSTPDQLIHCTHTGWSDTLYTTLQNMGTVGITYQLYNAGTPIGSAGSSGTFIITTAGTYSAQVSTAAGCSAYTNTVLVSDTCIADSICTTTDTIGIGESHHCGMLTLSAVFSPSAHFSSWSINDMPTATSVANPFTYTFTKAGFYQVTVYGQGTAGTDSCAISAQKRVTIPLVPAFEIFYECGGNVLKTRLVDISTYVLDSVAHWQWEIDAGIVSTSKNPLLTVSPGPHTFKLKVWNNRDTCEVSRTDTVPFQPHASFTATDSTCSGNSIHFVSTSSPSADIISYLWNYYDNTSSTLNPSDRAYTCTSSGFCTFYPSLKITDKYGCLDSLKDTIYIFKDQFVDNNTCISPDGVLTGCIGQVDTITIQSAGPAFACDVSFHQIIYDKYSWSNGTILHNNNHFTVSQTGTYIVTISDEFNCRKPFDPIIAILGNIHAQITGDTTYCIGDKTFLNIFSGRKYIYSWLRKTGLSPDPPQAYNLATDKPYIMKDPVDDLSDNNQYWGIVTDPTSGCSDTVGPLRIHIYSKVNSPFVVTSSSTPACVSRGPVTLTVSSAAADYFLWSNGVIGSSIVVAAPGFYIIDMIDTNGCDAGDTTINVKSGPDFSQLISGCYDKCIGDTLVVQGPVQSGASYHWLEDGVPVSSTYTRLSGRELYIWGRTGHHVYRLDMEVNGCRDTSAVIDVDFVLCPERNTCIDADSTNITCQNCIEDTTAGERHYSLVLHVHYTGTTVANPIQVLSSDSALTINNFYPNYLNPVSIGGGWNTLSISVTADSPYTLPYCIVIRVSDACQYTYCFSPSVTCRKH